MRGTSHSSTERENRQGHRQKLNDRLAPQGPRFNVVDTEAAMIEATVTPTVSVPRASNVLSSAASLAAIPDMITSGILPRSTAFPQSFMAQS